MYNYKHLLHALFVLFHPLSTLVSRYGKSPAQCMIRWSLQRGYVCIPKSSNEGRIKENSDIFDFEISEEDMTTMVSKGIGGKVVVLRSYFRAIGTKTLGLIGMW